jgi:hypothetical protein
MRHLVLFFLFFAVNSLPEEFNLFLEDYTPSDPLAYVDESDLANPTSIDGSPDLFGSEMPWGTGLAGEEYPEEPSLFSDVDGAWTSSSPINAISALPANPQTDPAYACPGGTALACCFQGRMADCIWYNGNDPWCFYPEDYMCCRDIEGLQGKECSEAPLAQAQGNPIIDGILDVLSTEVSLDWLLPLVGNGVGGLLEGQ